MSRDLSARLRLLPVLTVPLEKHSGYEFFPYIIRDRLVLRNSVFGRFPSRHFCRDFLKLLVCLCGGIEVENATSQLKADQRVSFLLPSTVYAFLVLAQRLYARPEWGRPAWTKKPEIRTKRHVKGST